MGVLVLYILDVKDDAEDGEGDEGDGVVAQQCHAQLTTTTNNNQQYELVVSKSKSNPLSLSSYV